MSGKRWPKDRSTANQRFQLRGETHTPVSGLFGEQYDIRSYSTVAAGWPSRETWLKAGVPGANETSAPCSLPVSSGGQGSGGHQGEGDDEFRFVLSREEFLDLFLEDLELPDAQRVLA